MSGRELGLVPCTWRYRRIFCSWNNSTRGYFQLRPFERKSKSLTHIRTQGIMEINQFPTNDGLYDCCWSEQNDRHVIASMLLHDYFYLIYIYIQFWIECILGEKYLLSTFISLYRPICHLSIYLSVHLSICLEMFNQSELTPFLRV